MSSASSGSLAGISSLGPEVKELWMWLSVLFLSGFVVYSARAQSVRLEFPLQRTEGVPAGFTAPPTELRGATGRIELPLRGLAQEASLFATFVFEERPGDAIVVTWLPERSGAPHVLSSNLCEGVRGWNQRTLRIPAEVAEEEGRVVIHESGVQPLLRAVVLRWLSPQAVFVDGPASHGRLLNVDGRVLSDDQIDGESFLSPPDAWFGDVIEAYWQSGVEAMDQPLQFDVPIGKRPEAVVLRAEMLGVASGAGARVWVNEQFAGSLIPATPDLRDPGYFRDADGAIHYAGWRRAALLVDPALLSDGTTSVVIEGLTGSVFLKNAVFQLMFGRQGSEPVAATGSDLMDTPPIGSSP